MACLIVILLYACKLAFLALSACVKIIEFSLKSEARKAYLHVNKIILLIPAIYEIGLFSCQPSAQVVYIQIGGVDLFISLLFRSPLVNTYKCIELAIRRGLVTNSFSFMK